LVNLASLAHETNYEVETLNLHLVLCQCSYLYSGIGGLITSAIKALRSWGLKFLDDCGGPFGSEEYLYDLWEVSPVD
jgi:hypothetical protein